MNQKFVMPLNFLDIAFSTKSVYLNVALKVVDRNNNAVFYCDSVTAYV